MSGLSEREGLELLREAGAAMVAAVERELPGWAVRRAGPEVRATAVKAAERVAAELEALFALDPDEQRFTPLQIVRSVEQELGFFPDTWADLDEDLAPLHITWGVAKATIHKARHEPS